MAAWPAPETCSTCRRGNPARVRFTVHPAGNREAWVERIAEIDRDGGYLPGGWPKPVRAARLLLDFDGEAHAARVPLGLQRRAAEAVLRRAQSRR